MKLSGKQAVLSVAAIAGLAMAVPSYGVTGSVNFNTASTDYTGNFFAHAGGTLTGANAMTGDTSSWNGSVGVQDQPGPTAGGGVTTTSGTGNSPSFQTDVTALYSPGAGTAAAEQLFSVSDGSTSTISAYVKFTGTTNGNDKPLQIGFAPQGTTGFNTGNSAGNGSPGPVYFISARILASGNAQTQYATGGATTSGTSVAFTGVTAGDWLKLTMTMTTTGTAGFFSGSFGVQDFGASGVATPTTAVATTAFTNLGNANLAGNLVAGFRINDGTNTSVATVDNFSVTADAAPAPEPGTLGLLSVGALGLLARRRRA